MFFEFIKQDKLNFGAQFKLMTESTCLFVSMPFLCVWGAHQVMLRTYSLLCAQLSLLVVLVYYMICQGLSSIQPHARWTSFFLYYLSVSKSTYD